MGSGPAPAGLREAGPARSPELRWVPNPGFAAGVRLRGGAGSVSPRRHREPLDAAACFPQGSGPGGGKRGRGRVAVPSAPPPSAAVGRGRARGRGVSFALNALETFMALGPAVQDRASRQRLVVSSALVPLITFHLLVSQLTPQR